MYQLSLSQFCGVDRNNLFQVSVCRSLRPNRDLKRFLNYPCNYVFGKIIEVSFEEMHFRYINALEKPEKCHFAPTRHE